MNGDASRSNVDADAVVYEVRPDHTIQLSNGRTITPMQIVRNIHHEPDRMPIVAVERIGRRLSVSCVSRSRNIILTQAFAILAEDERTWPMMTSETFPGTIVTVANDDPHLFRMPGGAIARFPYRVGFGVHQISEDRFVVSCAPGQAAGPEGDNIFLYDDRGELLWRVGRFPSRVDGSEYPYTYGVAMIHGDLWGLTEKARCARIDLRTGDVLEAGFPPQRGFPAS